MQGLPPPPHGFTIDTPQAGAPIGRPVIRKGIDPQSKVVKDNFLIDPNTGSAKPIAGLPAEVKDKTTYRTLSAKDVAARGLAPGSYQMGSDGKIDKIGDAPKGAAANPRDAALELRNVIDNAFRAKELSSGWFATGAGSGLARKFGGTTASDVKAKLDTIGANTAFEQLQKMRDNSPTGGALGAITERELDLLKSTIASLDQAQSDDEFQGAMKTIAESYGRVLLKIPGGRAMMIERGWLPKSSKSKPAAKSKPQSRVVDFNDLPE